MIAPTSATFAAPVLSRPPLDTRDLVGRLRLLALSRLRAVQVAPSLVDRIAAALLEDLSALAHPDLN